MDSMVEEPLLTSSSNGQPGSQPPNRIPNIPEDNNSLFSIVKKGTLKKLKSELRKTRKSLLTQTDENGKTILHHAVEFGKSLRKIFHFQIGINKCKAGLYLIALRPIQSQCKCFADSFLFF